MEQLRKSYQSYENFNVKVNPDTQILFASDERKSIMEGYSTLAMLDSAFGPESASSWLVTALANLNKFTGSKNMDDEQTKKLALLLAQEYKDMKYSMMQLFFYRFKCGHFGKFYGKVDPMVITCALKDFAVECDAKRQEYLNEEYLVRKQEEETFRQSVNRQWPEFLRELCGILSEKGAKNIVSDVYIDTIFVPERLIQLSVTKEQYELLEKDNIAIFASVFRKHYPGLSVRYRLRPQKTALNDAVDYSGRVRKKFQVFSEIEVVCRSAHAILDNVYRLDESGVDSMRLAFQKRYGCWPEDYLSLHEDMEVSSDDATKTNQ